MFDKNETDDLNFNVLQTEIKYFGRNLLQLAYSGERQKFITTFAVQKCLLDLWNNGYVEQLRNCRIDSDTNEIHFHRIDLKILASYLSIGLLAPLFLYSNKETASITEQVNNIDDSILKNDELSNISIDKSSYDNNDNSFKKDDKIELKQIEIINNKNEKKSQKEEDYTTYLFKYKNFMCSPKTNFVYETVSFFIIFILFISFI
jgi:hypothetical protein